MKKTLLFVLALIAVGCADDGDRSPLLRGLGRSSLCEGLSEESPLEVVGLCGVRGDVFAQHNLGVRYANGEGVPEDDAEAVRWYRLAAEQGHQDSQWSLGRMYRYGEGIPEDQVLAYMWYNLAAAQGNVMAQIAQSDKDIIELTCPHLRYHLLC